MTTHNNPLQTKLLAIVFGLIFIALIGMLTLNFLKPEPKINILNREFDYPLDQVWQALYDKENYINSKKEISKYFIYDTIYPRWTEYYSSSDSVENKTKEFKPKKSISYSIINKKYEQVNGISIRLDSLSPQKTNVKIVEKSLFNNSWAGIYFQLLHPNTVIDYEFVKLNNTLKYMDSVSLIKK